MKVNVLFQEEFFIKYIIIYKRTKLYSKGKNEGFRYQIKTVLYSYHYGRVFKKSKFFQELGFKNEAYPEFYFHNYKYKALRQSDLINYQKQKPNRGIKSK